MTSRYIKKYGPVMVVFGLVLAAVLFRAFSWSGFRYDASAWAEGSKGGRNIIHNAQAGKIDGDAMIIDIGPSFSPVDYSPLRSLRISPDSILYRNNFKKIRKHGGPVIIRSSDQAMAARLWMILSQKGIRNVFILRDSTDNQK